MIIMNNPVHTTRTSPAKPIIFYCKDCGKVVDTEKVGKKYVYKCKVCGTKNVAFGTEKSIRSFFRITEEEKKEAKIAVEEEKKAA